MDAGLIRWRTPDEVFDHFRLFTKCQPRSLSLDVEGDEADEIDLTVERVRRVAESRLRSARLYDSDPGFPSLWVTVLTGPAFVRLIELKKWTRDEMTGLRSPATTWQVLGYGTHAADAGFIMQGLSEQLDGFILEYLRANEGYLLTQA